MTYSAASTLAAGAAGFGLGLLGFALPLRVRIGAVALLSLVSILVGLAEASGRFMRPLQCDAETPRQWLGVSWQSWALRNGAVLGCGGLSRIAFWAWYVLPLSCLLVAQPFEAATLYALYGFVRSTALWPLHVAVSDLRFEALQTWLLLRIGRARQLSGTWLIIVGLVAALRVM